MDNNKNDNNIVRCLRRSGSLNKTKEQQPFTLHNVTASKVQQVKYSKKWNSFDLIADVDDLNNLNNFVGKELIFLKTSERNSIATISILVETLSNIRINKVAIDYAP